MCLLDLQFRSPFRVKVALLLASSKMTKMTNCCCCSSSSSREAIIFFSICNMQCVISNVSQSVGDDALLCAIESRCQQLQSKSLDRSSQRWSPPTCYCRRRTTTIMCAKLALATANNNNNNNKLHDYSVAALSDTSLREPQVRGQTELIK